MTWSRRLPLKPPQLAPTLRPLNFDDLKKGKEYPPNAVIWTEESFQALQRFLRDLFQAQEGGLPGGMSELPPLPILPDQLGDRGSEASGWSSGSHRHAAPTGMPVHVGPKLAEALGDTPAFSHSDHRHAVEMWRTFGITIDGGLGVPTPGLKGYIPVPYTGTIVSWAIETDIVGDCILDIWKSRKTPEVADTICGGDKPTLSGSTTSTGLPTNWTVTTTTPGDIIGFNLDSASTVRRITLIVTVRET